MAGQIDYEVVDVPSEKDPEEYTYAERRAAILADASDGGLTVTLPPVADDLDVTVKKIDDTTNAVTIETPGTETIDGESEIAITNPHTVRSVTANETRNEYFII